MIVQDDWDRHWDSMVHTPNEYQAEIKSLRQRVAAYVKEIDDLRAEKHALAVDWVKALEEINELRARIAALTGGDDR